MGLLMEIRGKKKAVEEIHVNTNIDEDLQRTDSMQGGSIGERVNSYAIVMTPPRQSILIDATITSELSRMCYFICVYICA